MKFYKVVWPWGESLYGKGIWSLPTKSGPGEWMLPIKGELIPCKNGYHGCTKDQLPLWEKRHTITYEMECNGEIILEDKQVITRMARLTKVVQN